MENLKLGAGTLKGGGSRQPDADADDDEDNHVSMYSWSWTRDRGNAQALTMARVASWQLSGGSAAQGGSGSAGQVSLADQAENGRVVQAVAADEWACYAGCTDGAIRCWVMGSPEA
jgi:hypothetical protein